MSSPFPGMDPYLEGYLWPDFHNGLAFVIKELLVPQVVPKYLVHMNIYMVRDTSAEEDIGIMYPDVEISNRVPKVEEPQATYAASSTTPFTPATHILTAVSPIIEVQIPVVEIRDKQKNELVTAIEILSPVNKRKPGLEPYREKRRQLYQSGVHLLEIDFLRRGKHPITHPDLPQSHYLVDLVRADSWNTEIWAIDVKDKLPIVAIPLKKGDEDVLLDLGKALSVLYERSFYQYSINYSEEPPPPLFSEEDQVWMKELLKQQET